MKDNKLEVGDKVYHINHARWGRDKTYIFDEVVRLTKTTAILGCGHILKIDGSSKNVFFQKVTNSSWEIVTPEIISDYEKEVLRQKANDFFSKLSREATDEQKLMIYNLLNKSE